MLSRKAKYNLVLVGLLVLFILSVVYFSYRGDYGKRIWSSKFGTSYAPEQFSNIRPLSFQEKMKMSLKLASRKSVAPIIHQSWKTQNLPSKRMKIWSASWRKCFPKWLYFLWTDEDNRALVAQFYPWFLKKYDALPKNIMRVDTVRYLYMHQFGGIYADLDTECLAPFEKLLNSSIVLGAMDGHWAYNMAIGHIQNSFMYSQPGHPLWIEVSDINKLH